MQEQGLQGKAPPRRFVRTTDSNHSMPVAPNLLARNCQANLRNQRWLPLSNPSLRHGVSVNSRSNKFRLRPGQVHDEERARPDERRNDLRFRRL